MAQSIRVLGIDPALRTTGYGAIERRNGTIALLEAGIVSPRADRPLEERLRELHAGIAEVIEQIAPQVIVIEELYTVYKNPQTAILMGHARGVMCLAGAQASIPVRTLGHSHVKRALVGSGSARKDQVNAIVTQLLRLTAPPKPNDVSDALAIALAYLNISDHPQVMRVLAH